MEDSEIITKIRESIRGKTWEDIYGREEAKNRREKFRKRMMGNSYAKNHIPWNKGNGEYIKGEKNPMYGKTHRKDTRKKMKNTWFKKGQIPWNKGFGDYIKGENNPRWLGGITEHLYPDDFNDDLKNQVKKRFGHKCAICGMSEEESLDKMGKSLAIHHIDFNKENNKLNNLVPLCFHCHGRITATRQILEVQ